MIDNRFEFIKILMCGGVEGYFIVPEYNDAISLNQYDDDDAAAVAILYGFYINRMYTITVCINVYNTFFTETNGLF